METGSTQHILERDGCPLHFWLSGVQGKPLVVFTHGAGCNHRMFDSQVAALQEDFQVLTWDVRGHGLSRPFGGPFSIRGAVDDLLAILEAVGAERAVFAGQSMGGNISQELVFLHPKRVQALVMIDCTCNTMKLSMLERLALWSSGPILRLYPHELLKRQSVEASAIMPEVRSYYYEALSRLTKEEFVRVFMETAACLHYEPDYNIAQPLLLTHGAQDGTGNIRRIAPVWAAREPQCNYVVIPNAGHLANMDNTEFFNEVLLDFLTQHTVGES